MLEDFPNLTHYFFVKHQPRNYQLETEGKMTKKHSNFSGQEQFHPILVILVAGSLSLAIVDQSNRPAYFDIVKIAVVYFFGTTKSQGNINKSNNLDDSEIPDSSDSAKCTDNCDKPK
ncbi:hypothetical protein [Nostoc sp.]|uniref:hypothetical protein n=1 Tax=Nostoc sp. TaxID=1180 RepID=UPI002FF4DC1F